MVLNLMRKLLKKYGFLQDKLVTDDLRSYGAAASELGLVKRRERVDSLTIEPRIRIIRPRRRKRKMQGFIVGDFNCL